MALTWLKSYVEHLTGLRLVTYDDRSIALIDQRSQKPCWFDYGAQLRHLLAKHRITDVIDVGANTGQFGLEIRRGFDGRLYSVEPVPATYERLAATAHGDPMWQTLPVALGRESGVATMHVAPSHDCSSFLPISEHGRSRFPRAVGTQTISVEVSRFDDLFATRLSPDARIFLKLDTQGYDLEAFAGVGRFLPQVILLQSELSLRPIYNGMPHWTHAITTYEAAGFQACAFFPVGLGDVEFDGLFVRHDTL